MGCATSRNGAREDRSYFETAPQQPWCPSCVRDFGVTRWRHHCRGCGMILCDDCLLPSKVPFRPRGIAEPVRLCGRCYPYRDATVEQVVFQHGVWQQRLAPLPGETEESFMFRTFLEALGQHIGNAVNNNNNPHGDNPTTMMGGAGSGGRAARGGLFSPSDARAPWDRERDAAGPRAMIAQNARGGRDTASDDNDDDRTMPGLRNAQRSDRQIFDEGARLFTLLALLHLLQQSGGAAASLSKEDVERETQLGWGPDAAPTPCAICQSDMSPNEDPNDTVRRLPCGHIYHKDCVDEWLTKHSATCPQCRATVGRGHEAAASSDDSDRQPHHHHHGRQEHTSRVEEIA